MATLQNRFNEAVVPGIGTSTSLVAATTYPIAVGEIAYATDTNQLYVGTDPATGGSFSKVPALATANVFTTTQQVTLGADVKALVLKANATQTANLTEWQNSSAGVLLSVSGLGSLNSAIAKTTYNGSVSGTAVWSMPFQGSAFKKFIIYLSALNDVGGTITFPTAFSHTPVIYGTAASLAICTASTTTFTIGAAATITGYVICEGD